MAPMPRELEPSGSLKAYFGWRLRHWRNVRALTQRQLGERTGDSDDEISKVETAERWPPPGLAERCDRELGTGGELAALWPLVERERTSQAAQSPGATIGSEVHQEVQRGQEVKPVPTRREVVGYLSAGMAAVVADRMLNHPIVAALDAKHRAGGSSLGPGAVEDLAQTVESFRLSYGRTRPERLEPDLIATRQYIGSLLTGKLTLDQHRELVVLAGWLSALLGLASFDLGNYAAAAIWCRDAEDRALEARHRELAAWSRDPLAIMAFYLDRPAEAIEHTRAGRAYAPRKSAAWAVHAAQEMRALARFGPSRQAEFTRARRRAERAIDRLPLAANTGYTFRAVHHATVPFFTAASLVMLENYQDAVPLAEQLVKQSESKSSPTGLALYRIEHALALAGLGHLDEAVATGRQVFEAPRLVKSIVNRAGDLDSALQRKFPQATETRDFHEQYVSVAAAHRSSEPRPLSTDRSPQEP